MSVPLYAEFQKHNLFRKPDWRWERILQMCDRAPVPGRCTRRDDSWVRAAREFLLKYRAFDDLPERRQELFWQCQGLYYAHDVHERSLDEPEAGLILQARILARQSYEEIARSTGVTVDTVQWYEALFFNVSDRLEQRDWISRQVLIPAVARNQTTRRQGYSVDMPQGPATPFATPFYDVTLKFFAYFAGPVVLDVMLTGFQPGRRVDSEDQVHKFLSSHISLNVMRRAAAATLQFDVNQYNIMELMHVVTKVMEIEHRVGVDENAQSTLEKHVLGMIKEIPWLHGDKGKKGAAGTDLGVFDEGSAELRDQELLPVAANETPPELRGLEKFELSPESHARKKADPTPPVENKS